MRWMWKSSIAKNLFGSFLLVIIPLIITSLLVNNLSINIVNNQVSKSYQNSLELLSVQINNNLNKFRSLSNTLAIDSDLNALNQSPADPMIIWDYSEILKQLKLYSLINDLDSNITIYLLNKKRILSSKNGMERLTEKKINTIKKMGFNKIGKWQFTESNEAIQFSLYQQVGISNKINNNNILVNINIAKSEIERLLSNLNVQGGGTVFLTDKTDNIILPANKSFQKKDKINKLLVNTNTKDETIYYKNKEYYVLTTSIKDTDLLLGMFFPRDQIMAPIKKIRFWIIILILSLGLSLIFIFISYRNLLLPIHRLVFGMREVKKGNLDVVIKEEDKGEYGFLQSQFNNMVSQLKAMINEVYVEHLKYQQAQLNFLQSQINPHFLYNCLNFIYEMAKGKNNEGAARMAIYLGRYFRYATKANQDMIKLKNELSNIETYIEIQKMRYPDKINYHVDVPEDVKEILIPGLSIQPIIENAIVHGIEETNRPGTIWVKSRKKDDLVKIIIEDNGKGIAGEELKKIRKKLKNTEEIKSGYGLSNPHLRLKLKFGERAGIKIEKKKPYGTRVIVSIPFKQGREE